MPVSMETWENKKTKGKQASGKGDILPQSKKGSPFSKEL
jgi:hypothetical protein